MTREDLYKEINDDFLACGDFFTAIGNEIRQSIIVSLIKAGPQGVRVGELTKDCHLSRPAVSHHLKILKDAGVAHIRKEGTMNYYYVCIRDLLPVLEKAYVDLKNLLELENEQ